MVESGKSMDAGLGANLSVAEMSAAEKVIHSIMTGMKNYPVFPADHASTASLLKGVKQAVARFTDEYGELGFEVSQKQILYADIPVYSGEASVDNPAHLFYRDGIRYFSFSQGLEEAELAVLFKLVNHYRVIPDEPEDDIVTALWRAELPHILYEASYELWDAELQTDLSLFKPNSPEPAPGFADLPPSDTSQWEKLRPGTADYQQVSIAETQGDQGVWDLSPEEQEYINQLIKEELAYDSSEAAVRLMFLVLRDEGEAPVYEAILNYIKDEFSSSLFRRDFRRSYFILENIRKTEELLTVNKTWTAPIHNRFRDDITRPGTLQPLLLLWPVLPTLPGAEIKNFVAVLQLLPTKAGLTLAAMLAQVTSSQARGLITEIVASYASRDQLVLEALLIGADEDLALRMLRVVRDLPDRDEATRLLGLVTNNSGQRVRTEARRMLGWQNLY